jgi:hypothetical protein
MQNDVRVLLVDQVLGDQPPPGEPALEYKGHGVVESIRKVLPNFPVYVFTSYQDDSDLPDHLADAEYVIPRENLRQEIDIWVPRMVRSGQRFHEEHERQLQTITALAAKVATGSASNDEKEELNRLQIAMGTPISASVNLKREEALAGAETKVTEIETLISELEALINEKRK